MASKEKALGLKKCASTNEISALALSNLSLREAKSYAGDNNKYTETNQRYQQTNKETNCLELFCKDYDMQPMNNKKNVIATKDVLTDEIYYVNEDVLTQYGKKYTCKDIAVSWKKDCRMWLWKNSADLKKNKSASEFKRTLN